ncbi:MULTISPECIES: hypothetical protein [unclassified Saccharicrinis]|uniref:hypothetical protein n=1 Tax=unclassified Saccharicrinis TaxID=2646859 RepID=UPI003D33F631
MIKPPKIFLYYIIVLVLFGALGYFIPKEGIELGESGYKVRWISFDNLLKKNIPTESVTESDPIEIDSLQVVDSLELAGVRKEKKDSVNLTIVSKPDSLAEDSIIQKLKLQYPSAFKRMLYSFYQEIESADELNRVIRIMHMGDSQIEGDRISKYLRESFQRQFKGSGPGLIPLYDPKKQFPTVWINNKGAWSEHLVYQYPRIIEGNQYGIMGKVAKIDPAIAGSRVEVSQSSMAQPRATNYYKSRLFLKNIEKPLVIDAYWGNDLISSDSLQVDDGITEINWTFKRAPRRFSLSFESEQSPLFLGMSLDSLSGVSVDNISMRGQSSPRLDKTDTLLYKSMAEYMNIGLVILQYGTNMVPTVTENYDFYSLTFYRQLEILKKTMPGVPVLVVGVGDVGKLIDGKAHSYKHIFKIKEAQKEAAFKAGFAFFDLFEAMGGEGSILKWVNGDPKLAMSDYTHFSKPGGKKVADWLYKAIMSEYEDYKKNLLSTK